MPSEQFTILKGQDIAALLHRLDGFRKLLITLVEQQSIYLEDEDSDGDVTAMDSIMDIF